MNFKSLHDAMQYFSSDDKCWNMLFDQRWPDGNVICPKCGTDKAYTYGNTKWFKCRDKIKCGSRFTITVGTIFENTKLPLSKWFAAIWLISAHKKGISSCQLARDLGIGQKAAWFVLHRVREMMQDKAPQLLDNVVEIDETYCKGKTANKSRQKRQAIKEGRLADTTVPVMGLVEREGKAVFKIIGKEPFKEVVRRYVNPDAVIVTDAQIGYQGLEYEFAGHIAVNHSQNEYKTGIYHTNTVEGFFANLKRGIYGIYHQVSPKHLHRYLEEFSCRYNSRKVKDAERFMQVLKQSKGRLKYAQLIQK